MKGSDELASPEHADPCALSVTPDRMVCAAHRCEWAIDGPGLPTECPIAHSRVFPGYSQATKDAHGAVIEAGLRDDLKAFVLALRQLATMVHCDITGELREPHTLAPIERSE